MNATITPSASIKPARVGSVSTGTLRTEDLLSEFMSTLESMILINGDYFSIPENRDERDKLNNLVGEAQDCWNEDGEGIDPDKEDDAEELVESITSALESFAPPYCYFGSHPGDGADFGFWPSWEQIEDLPCLPWGEEHGPQEDDYREVTDHGNVTVFSADGKAILELV